jgi:hypothetical protein
MDSCKGKVMVVLAASMLVACFFVGLAFAENAVVVQEYSGPFDNPEGSVVLDNQIVFVSNAGAVDGAFPAGSGYITKLTIGPGGQLATDTADFVTGLTRPWGMAVLPVDVGAILAGAIFVGVAGLDDPSDVQSSIVAFDPDDGTIVGVIKAGPASAFEAISGGPVLAINALAFDQAGNLYFTDTALGYGDCIPIRQGVWKVEASSLEGLLAGGTDSIGISFCYIAGAPDGIEVSPSNELYVNTVGLAPAAGFGLPPLYDPFVGAIYRLTDDDFAPPLEEGGEPFGFVRSSPLLSGLGALDGLVFTPGGTMLCTEIGSTNDIVSIKPGILQAAQQTLYAGQGVKFLGVPGLNGPADISVAKIGRKTFVIIPEHTSFGPPTNPEDDQVTVIQLIGAP